jgi:hypothetical protein
MARFRRRSAPVLALTAWSLVLPTAGCYAYVPVASTATPSLGESTVVLNTAGTAAVQRRLGDNVRELDGPILRVSADSLTLTVTQFTTVTRERFPQNGVEVSIARAHVEQVQTRTYSRKRTWGLIGTVAAILALALGAGTAASASSGGEGGGGIQP